ncbi:tagatose 1,6-diphosphate aldolase [Aeromicrobium sp. Root236]|uniref:tagatose 1,6-diphosphate aldolase n=1 Tax=Aeromicrobium sp. Root236 TaxID=1736498 RepID=UPI0009EB359B|nr:tagatose 1,6-diphosphate aldolase [Aeromicrobium sp. Root236]
MLRRIQRMSDADGYIRVAAIDHPENYVALFDPDLSKVGFDEVVDSKLELIRGMAPHCSAVLVDPVWSFGQGVLTGSIPGGVGIISGLEQLAYSPAGFGTETVVRPHWTVPVLARLGADGAKLVVFYREEHTDIVATQHELVRGVVAQCREHEVPLIVEPLWYPLEGESLDDPAVRAARVEAIISSAATFTELGADIMKVEFPGYVGTPEGEAEAAEACARLDAAVDVPWVLLSASATFDQFAVQLRIAAEAGACGFMAGRAIWGDGVGRHDAETRARGVRTAAERLDTLADVLRTHARPWREPVSVSEAVEALPADWHEAY